MSAIEQVRRVTSVSKDEASTVTASSSMPKGLDSAATDAGNALQKVRALLPETARSRALQDLVGDACRCHACATPRERSPSIWR